MPPTWLTVLAWCALGVAFACGGEIVYDIVGRGYRQKMRVMEFVWPVTALYFGPAATWAYRRFGRRRNGGWANTASTSRRTSPAGRRRRSA